jgi:hypothetical protein
MFSCYYRSGVVCWLRRRRRGTLGLLPLIDRSATVERWATHGRRKELIIVIRRMTRNTWTSQHRQCHHYAHYWYDTTGNNGRSVGWRTNYYSMSNPLFLNIQLLLPSFILWWGTPVLQNKGTSCRVTLLTGLLALSTPLCEIWHHMYHLHPYQYYVTINMIIQSIST